jgi:membrane protease YdiL (CAAX protease family)
MKIVPIRLIVLFSAFLALYIGLQIAISFGLHAMGVHGPVASAALARALLTAPVMIIAYRLCAHWIEDRRAEELSAKAVFQLIPGAILGVALFSGVYGVLWLIGVAHIGGYSPNNTVLDAAALSIVAAVGEEIVFRGVLFRILEQGYGTLAAALVSSVVFGLLHVINPGATWWSTAAIALEAGLLLGSAYAATRTLWIPIGLHFGWNFAEGGIFSAAVSGGHEHGLLAGTLTGPALWTGGAFGPEASIVATLICLAASVAFFAVAIARGRWEPARFRLRFS